ncbi:MAG: alanine--glyoxylate aminotransferase family protein [Tissierellaceae bacterium]|nr:alanine--glyoxylate aminotransferase family protein [Tissierellaceae bacterium]
MHTKLFIPGPVDVREDVLAKMSLPQISHRGKEASQLQKRISENMQKIWKTKEEIILSTSSGSGLMEGAIRSCTLKKAAVFSIGAFGKRWYEMAIDNGVDADIFESKMGEATGVDMVDKVLKTGKYDLVAITHNETSTGIANPIDEIAEVIKKYPDIVFCVDMVSSACGHEVNIDDLGIDIVITSSQKCLGLPAGLSLCTFSKKAIERAKMVKNRGHYLDLLKLYNYIIKKDYQYPSTPSISHMFALDYQLDYILNVEGLENRYKRHIKMAEVVRNWAREKFQLFGDEKYLSRTVTAISNTRNIDVSALNNELKKRGMMISNGYGDLKDKTFRIAHMADTQVEDINELLNNIDDILNRRIRK